MAIKYGNGSKRNTNDIVLDRTNFKLGVNTPCSERKGKAWFVAKELQSDLIVEVSGVTFHLQKFPLLSKSGLLNRFVFESRTTDQYHIRLDDSPGGSEAFELAARFCYGIDVSLNVSNVASIRCISEYLEMTDDLEERNLLSKTESFLTDFVFPSWSNSIVVLQSCEHLDPWAQNLKITERCVESIAWKASTDPQGIMSPRCKFTRADRTKCNETNQLVPEHYWFDDLIVLGTIFFVKVITAMKMKGMKPEFIGVAISNYALKRLSNVTKEQELSSHVMQQKHYRASEEVTKEDLDLIEKVVSILPCEEHAISNKFLIHLVRVANKSNADLACKRDLEKRIGWQLEYATLSDLLVPNFGREHESLFDVELVQRIVEFFLLKEKPKQMDCSPPLGIDESRMEESPKFIKEKQATWRKVVKLLDSYLSEIAKDQNLSLIKFQAFAELVPESVRFSHDGLYQAIDIFLKTHSSLMELDRKKLCKIIDWRKLSPQACMHAAQNDHLPLRIIVQILFGEHMKVRNSVAMSAKDPTEFAHAQYYTKRYSTESDSMFEDCFSQSNGWAAVQQELKSMRGELEKMKTNFSEFVSEYNHQQEMHNLGKQNILPSWLGGWRKFRFPRCYLHLSIRGRNKRSKKQDALSPDKRSELWKQSNRRHSLS